MQVIIYVASEDDYILYDVCESLNVARVKYGTAWEIKPVNLKAGTQILAMYIG